MMLLAASGALYAADYHVDPGSGPNTYTTIQAALDAVTNQSASERANILITPGTYNEELEISKPYVSLVGLGDAADQVAIVGGGQGIGEPGVNVKGGATGFMATNLTFENPLPDHVAQGLAIRSSADKAAFQNVRFLGYQDTILVDNNSRQYFKDVFITGDTDFIFGNATAVFDHATIQSTDGGYVTAAATDPSTANGLVFLDCTLVPGTARTGSPPTSPGDNEVYLGRPWQWDRGTMPSTIFIRTKMGEHIRTVGWNDWGSPEPDADSRYSEYGSMDLDGDPLPLGNDRVPKPAGRVAWADGMSQHQAIAYTLENIFGPVAFWNNNPDLVPEGTGQTYQSQGDGQAWDPVAQLQLLPSIAKLSGDFNDDGVVNLADYAVWRNQFGALTALPNESASPGVVDTDDYATWRDNFGATSATSTIGLAEYSTVPEPSTLLIVTGGVMLRGIAQRSWRATQARDKHDDAGGNVVR